MFENCFILNDCTFVDMRKISFVYCTKSKKGFFIYRIVLRNYKHYDVDVFDYCNLKDYYYKIYNKKIMEVSLI